MFVIEIALGIVLAVLILKYLPEILGLGVIVIFAGIAIILAAVTIYFLYQGAISPEFKAFLHSPEVTFVFGFVVWTLFILGMYKVSLEGTNLEKGFPVSMLIGAMVVFLFGLIASVDDGDFTKSFLCLIASVFLVSLLFLRYAVGYGFPFKTEEFARRIIPPRIMLWLGFKVMKEMRGLKDEDLSPRLKQDEAEQKRAEN